MNEQGFIFWLKGFTDGKTNPPKQEEWDRIRHELALVFNKITPYRPNEGSNLESSRFGGFPIVDGKYINITC